MYIYNVLGSIFLRNIKIGQRSSLLDTSTETGCCFKPRVYLTLLWNIVSYFKNIIFTSTELQILLLKCFVKTTRQDYNFNQRTQWNNKTDSLIERIGYESWGGVIDVCEVVWYHQLKARSPFQRQNNWHKHNDNNVLTYRQRWPQRLL